MKIYFIRHGQDDENYRGGWSDLGLTPIGMKQASQLGRFLSEHKREYLIMKIISSDLNRAVQTAIALQKELNIPLALSKTGVK